MKTQLPQSVSPLPSSSPKRQTVQVTTWVKPAVKAELQRVAATEGLTLSKLSSAFLEEAVQQRLHTKHAVLLQPIIEQTIQKEIRTISNRIALLLARGVYESGQTKRLVVHVLKQKGLSQTILKAILEDSSKGARATLLRKTPQLAPVLTEVERWLAESEGVK